MADPSATRVEYERRLLETPAWMRRPIAPVVARLQRRRAWCSERRVAAARCWSVIASWAVLLAAFWAALP